jgi:hypothetical protein
VKLLVRTVQLALKDIGTCLITMVTQTTPLPYVSRHKWFDGTIRLAKNDDAITSCVRICVSQMRRIIDATNSTTFETESTLLNMCTIYHTLVHYSCGGRSTEYAYDYCTQARARAQASNRRPAPNDTCTNSTNENTTTDTQRKCNSNCPGVH